MNILITGAGGFLGQYLSRELAKDHNVIALTRQELDLSSLTAAHDYFKDTTYDVVVNCAAAGRNTPGIDDQSIVSNNLASIFNLMTYRNHFGKLINIGSGAEFDIDQNIDQVDESEIWNRKPQYSYGQSKNIIARFSADFPKTTTLRLFGCFDPSESEHRLLKRFQSTIANQIPFFLDQDRYFDMVSAKDFVTVIKAVLNNTIQDQDLNVVYDQKYRLSDILMLYSKLHEIDTTYLHVRSVNVLNYTGNGSKLAKYELALDNLEQSLLLYGK